MCYLFIFMLVDFVGPDSSNLFTFSTLIALDLYMKYTADEVNLCMYIMWFTSV